MKSVNRALTGLVSALSCLAGTAWAVDIAEVEPNESKATATVANNGGAGLDSGDAITGTTTGSSTTTPGAASADYFIVTTKARPLGIYEHTLTLTTTGTAGHTFTIRGLSQSGGTIGTTDSTAQTGSTTYPGAPTGARVIKWYGFGKQERVYVRVLGTTSTTGAYRAVLQTTAVTPVAMTGGSLIPGDIAVRPDAATDTAMDTDWWVLDPNLAAISGFGHDDADITAITRSLTAGTYTLAMSRANFANNLASPSDDTYRTGVVLDFADAVACSLSTLNTNATMLVSSGTSTSTASASTTTPFTVMFYQFAVQTPTLPTPPTGSGTWSSASVLNCGDRSVTARVATTGGLNPASTGISVVANLSSIGGSAAQTMYDDGTNGDATAGDGTFSFTQIVSAATPAAGATFGFTVSDAQARSSSGTSASLTVGACPTGACCTPSGCVSLTQFACGNAAGIYRGDSVPCVVPPGYAVVGGASAFEDISGVGTPVTLGDDTTTLVPVGFSFPFYGGTYTDVNFCSNGFVNFGTSSTSLTNGAIPSAGVPNNAIYGLWDDLNCTGRSCYYATLGTAGTDLRFIAQWTAVPQFAASDSNTFQVVLFESGVVEVRYGAISAFTGNDATIGVENSTGTVAASVPDSTISSNTSIRFGLTPAVATCASDPTGVGSAAAVQNCGDRSALLTVAVTPGLFPTSTGITVTADASSLGGSSTLALNDAGLNGDTTAGDNIFSAGVPVAYTVTPGSKSISFTIADAQGRTGRGSFAASVTLCSTRGACCLPSGCEQESPLACVGRGGSYIGNNVPCIVPPGYVQSGAGSAFEDISAVGTPVALTDDSDVLVPVGFTFPFYSGSYTDVRIVSNGFLNFSASSTAFVNVPIPNAAVPNNSVYALWDDLNPGAGGQVHYATLGTAGINQRFIAQWTNVPQYNQTDSNTFQAVLFPNGDVELRYAAIAPDFTVGSDTGGATVGVENSDGTIATSVPIAGVVSNTSILLSVTGGGPSCSSCPACAADYNVDGGVDGGDIAAFFVGWESSAACADVNLDGGIDGGDIEYFFRVWEAGGC